MTASATVLALWMLNAAPALASGPTFYLNIYDSTDAPSQAFCTGPNMLTSTPPGCGSSVAAPVVFTSGDTYTVEAVGAVSVWGQWPYRRCGDPEPASQFPSPGRPNTPAGDDAQFRFAKPVSLGACTGVPQKTQFFQVNLGSGWYHPIANNNPSFPSDDENLAGDQHPYWFTFVGQGVAPQFRFIDYHSSDNDGRFRITVLPPPV